MKNEQQIKEEKQKQIIIYFGIIFGCFGLLLILNPFYTVSAGERAIVLEWGKPQDVAMTEGLHFKIPLYQSIVKTDIRTQKYEADLSAASKDLQTVSTKIAINYRLNSESVVSMYKSVGLDYAIKIIQPTEQEVNKAATAQYTAEELVTKREEVREKMKLLLLEKLSARGIIVEEINIVDFDFSPSFNAAIEAKVTAEQEALTQKNKLEQIKYEADQRVAQAEGEAKAIKAQAEAIKAQGGSEYIALQWIKQWDGKLPTMMLDGDSSTMMVQLPISG
jgi:regulator of protease activity HflC (stomatin/prohibitin superfamily)